MIITKEWLNEFVDLHDKSSEDICIALNSIGLEVDSLKEINIPDGVVVGLVTSCIKHPDADKLNICQVNLGTSSVQIVCGAKNVAQGQYVPVATVGCNLGNDFIIKNAKLRGEDSSGMICSSTELGLEKTNDGILVLDNSIGELVLGKNLSEYPLINDDVIEIELTANRGDCLCIAGVAKDLSAYYNTALINHEFTVNENSEAIGKVLDIEHNDVSNSNLIYKVADIKELKLHVLFEIRAAAVGIQKNTDVEVLLAYSTHATGVLLNIYTQAIAEVNGKIKLNIKNDENNFTKVSGLTELSTIGIEAGYIAKEDNIVVLEANYTDPSFLSQTVFTTKEKTGDVYYKSSRGSNPDLKYGITYLTDLLSHMSATILKGQMDYINEIKNRNIDIDITKINKIIGQKIDKQKIENILTALGFNQSNKSDNNRSKIIPATRHDIVNIADVTEEIVRIVGIDNIKAQPLKMEELNNNNKISKKLIKKNKIRSLCVANHFFETTTYVFSSKKLLEKYNFDTVDSKKDILNPITEDLNTFRTTLSLNLVLAASANEKQGFKSISLFEIGTIFNKNRDESVKIGFLQSGYEEEESLKNGGKPKNIDLFSFAQKITNCIGEFELEVTSNVNNSFFHPYQSANIVKYGQAIGTISKLHPNVCNDFDISNDTFVAQIDFDTLRDDLVNAKNSSKYQTSKRDLSIVVSKDLPFKEVKVVLNALDIPELKQYNLIDIYSDDSLENKESLTIKFVLQSDEKTLEEEDITSIMDNILNTLKSNLEIELR